ncbi:hypothetical protein EPO44_05655 [bacterium]|nr:MAG: hypothetical protein EPO44_05655 [bacterium]
MIVATEKGLTSFEWGFTPHPTAGPPRCGPSGFPERRGEPLDPTVELGATAQERRGSPLKHAPTYKGR